MAYILAAIGIVLVFVGVTLLDAMTFEGALLILSGFFFLWIVNKEYHIGDEED